MKKLVILGALLVGLTGCMEANNVPELEEASLQTVEVKEDPNTVSGVDRRYYPESLLGHSVTHIKTDTCEKEIVLYNNDDPNDVLYLGSNQEIPNDIMIGYKVITCRYDRDREIEAFGVRHK